MLARYVQKGDSIDYRPTDFVVAGDVVVIADLIGIARLDIASGTLGTLAVVGVFDIVKVNTAIPSGAAVYWDAGAKKATQVSGSNHYLGKTVAASGADDDTVRVLLNAPYSLAAPFNAGDSITSLADNSGGVAADTITIPESGDCKDAIASLTAKTNMILAALRTVGIIAGA